ncbi:MAG: PA2169 family four-helix-bundle protein [Lysobacteraceae bacterium]
MKSESKVKELIQSANDGATFYVHALKHVDDPHLRRVFTEMGRHKRELVASLRRELQIDEDTAVESEGTIAGAFRRAYTDMLAMLGGNDAKVYVGQLEETEDRLLDSLREAIEEIDDPKVVAILRSHLPQIVACHDDMRALKAQMAT